MLTHCFLSPTVPHPFHHNQFSLTIPCALCFYPLFTHFRFHLLFYSKDYPVLTNLFFRPAIAGTSQMEEQKGRKWRCDAFQDRLRGPTATLDECAKLSLRPAWLCKSTVQWLHQCAREPCVIFFLTSPANRKRVQRPHSRSSADFFLTVPLSLARSLSLSLSLSLSFSPFPYSCEHRPAQTRRGRSLSRTHIVYLSYSLCLSFSLEISDCPCEQDKHTDSRTPRHQLQCSPV